MHRIQLKGPWDYQVISVVDSSIPTVSASQSGTVKMPAAWREIVGDLNGQVRFTRKFNRPTNLDDHEHVHLGLDGISGTAEIRLNQVNLGQIMPPDSTCRFDIKPHLQLHNLLEITITWDGQSAAPGGLWGVVAIEITYE